MKTPIKNLTVKYLLVVILVFTTLGCADFDSMLDSKDLNLFKNKAVLEEGFRRYPEDNTLNLPPLVQFIVDYENPNSVRYSNHIKKVCDYTKIPFGTINIKSWNADLTLSPQARVICILETKKLNNASVEKMIDFTSKGGTLLIPFVNDDKRFSYLIGFHPKAEFDTDTKSKGCRFNDSFIPGLTGKTIFENEIHYGLKRQNFKPEIKIWAMATNNSDLPVVTENIVGNGRVVYYNTSTIMQKSDRGFLFAGILKGLESIPYPIANTSTVFLDDFPSPVYDTKLEPIKSEMNLSIAEFVQKVWWPDMIELAEKYNITYCAIPAFDYNAKTDPPFLFEQWDTKKVQADNKIEPLSSWLMRDCLKNKHELGFHGYNHVSLVKRDWKKPDFIVTSLENVRKKWQVSNFGDFPTSYVPPSNIIDATGLHKLKEGMPSLKYMCSIYSGELHEGGNREYDFDPFHPNFFNYPRISSGFYMTDNDKYDQQSLYLFTGIWNHFVHPDDVFQIPSPFNKSAGNYDLRNGRELGWRKTKNKNTSLLQEFDQYLKEITRLYPQIRFVNANEGGNITLDWRASQFNHSTSNGNYIVEELNPEKSISDNQYWFMYGSLANAEQIESQLKENSVIFSRTPFQDGYLYSIYTNQSKLVMKDLRPNQNDNAIASTEKYNYFVFMTELRNYELAVDSGEDYEEMIRLEKESLKKRILEEAEINYQVWNKYADYMNWTHQGEILWDMLEKHCLKYPTKNNVMYSQELAKIVWYPNSLTMEKWMSAQIAVSPNNADLLNSYLASFNTPENHEKVKEVLIALLSVDTGKNSLKNFIQHLLWYEPHNALQEVDKIEPSDDFRELATDITWLYANNKMHQKAYDWSLYSNEIEFSTKMYWLFELQQYDLLIDEYNKYIIQNPDDYRAKAVMSSLYQGMGKFKEAWELADSLPDSKEKEELRRNLNRDVVYVDDFLKQYLLQFYPDFFLPNVKEKLYAESRLRYGNFVETENKLQTNMDLKRALQTVHSFNFYDTKKNLHRIAATYSEYYPLTHPLTPDVPVEHNEYRRIYGIEYRFKNPFSYDKLQYWSRFRVEADNHSRMFFQAGAGLSISKNKKFSSFQVNIEPAETSPAHAKNIFQFKTNFYHSMYFMRKINLSFSFEGKYYTKSDQNYDFETDNNIEGNVTLRAGWNDGEPQKMKFIPYLETAYKRGSENLQNGYPYWLIESRFNGGAGLEWNYGLDEDKFRVKLDASYFLDDYSKEFQRFSGNVSYKFMKFTSITASFELYNQSKFYSNTIQFGLKHNFKEKQTK